MLQNSLSLFQDQVHPNKLLYILDDSGQHKQQKGVDWTLESTTKRFPNLSAKLNYMARKALELTHVRNTRLEDVILVVWEDDDVYFSWHLSSIADKHFQNTNYGKENYFTFFAPEMVWTNYGTSRNGEIITDPARGRFHASWAYSAPLFLKVGGYPKTNRLDFDQQMNAICRKHADAVIDYNLIDNYSYIYRWGSGDWNGSQAGEKNWRSFWDELGEKEVHPINALIPKKDTETLQIIKRRSES